MPETVTGTEGLEAITLLMPIIIGLFITPVVQGLKQITALQAVDPRYFTIVLSILAVWGMSATFSADMTWPELIRLALSFVGTATVGHLGLKQVKKIGSN